MFGQASDKCTYVVEARCGSSGQCSLSNLLYDCQHLNGRGSYNYLVIPCAAAIAQGTPVTSVDQAYCLLHMRTRNEHCRACCRDQSCRGSRSISTCPTNIHLPQIGKIQPFENHKIDFFFQIFF